MMSLCTVYRLYKRIRRVLCDWVEA